MEDNKVEQTVETTSQPQGGQNPGGLKPPMGPSVEEPNIGSSIKTGLFSRFNKIKKGVAKIKNDKEQSMSTEINLANGYVKEAEKRVLENFLAQLDPPVKSESELTDEQRKDFEEYKDKNLKSQIETIYKGAKDAIITVSKNRLQALQKKEQEAKSFERELKKEIEDRKNELEKTKNPKKRAELESEIKEINALLGRMDPEIYGSINKATKYQIDFNKECKSKLADTFKEYKYIDVDADKDIQASLDDNTKGKDELENTAKDNVNQQNKEEKKKEHGPKEKHNEERGEEGPSQVQNSAPGTGVAPTGAPEEVSFENGYPRSLRLQKMMGSYSRDINDVSCWNVLYNFTDSDLTNADRLEILSSPQYRALIMNSCTMAGGTMSPMKLIHNWSIRKKMLAFAKSNNSLMKEALKNMGIENYKKVEEAIKQANDVYSTKRKQYEELINSNKLSADEIAQAKKELKELDTNFKSISNVEQLSKSCGELRITKDKVKNYISSFIRKNDTTLIADKIKENNTMVKPDSLEEEKPISIYDKYIKPRDEVDINEANKIEENQISENNKDLDSKSQDIKNQGENQTQGPKPEDKSKENQGPSI